MSSRQQRDKERERVEQLRELGLCVGGPLPTAAQRHKLHGPVVRDGKCLACLGTGKGKGVPPAPWVLPPDAASRVKGPRSRDLSGKFERGPDQ